MTERPTDTPASTTPQPPERPVFNPEVLKAKYDKIDTLNETLKAVKEAKEDALKDIKADIAKVYPDDTPEGETKRAQEYKAVEKMLSRLEKSYLKAAKGSVTESTREEPGLYEFGKLIDEYFRELQTITGDTNPEEGKIDFSTVDPYEFWKNTAGWYETAEDTKTPGTESFKEKRIEKEGERWWDEIYKFQKGDSNEIKEGEEENFQNWIEAHREDLRRVILKQIDDRKYIIDFTNLSKNFTGAMADNVRSADFIAKNIGLADLFTDISQAITVWKGDKLYTGTLDKDFSRKNGLKGGYFHKNKYLEIWHGAVISTNPADQIAEDAKDSLPNDMFEESKEEITPRDPSSFSVEQQPKGEQVVKLTYKPTKNVQTVGPERAKLIEESVEKRKQILTPDGKNIFEIEYKYEKLYGGDTITTPGKTTFELQKPQPEFTDVNAELVYESKEFPNVEITIPYNKDNSFLLRVKSNKEEKDYPRATIYEFENLEALKQKLGEEIGKPEVANEQNKELENEEIPVVELDKSCSKETVDKYLNNIDKDRFYPLVVSQPGKVIVHGEVKGDNVKVEGKIEEKKTKLTDSDLTPEGIDKLPIEETTEELDLSGCTVTKESLEKLLAKAPKIKKISFDHSKLNSGDKILFIVADKLNSTLEELDLTGAAYDTEDLQYLQSCPELTTLKLGSSELIGDFEIEAYVSKLVNLKSLALASTSITNKSMEPLSKLVNLTFLDLSGTDTSFKATMELKKKLPGCDIKMSERAEKELEELLKEKIEELIKKHEPTIKEDLVGLLGEGISIQNTKLDYDKESVTTDVYFENQKITSADLTIKITDKDDNEISPEKLYGELFVSKNLDTKPETEEVSGNKLKRKATIGEKVIYMEKFYKFSDTDETIKERIEKIEKEKALEELPKKIQEKLETDFPGRDLGIKDAGSDESNIEQKWLVYKEAPMAIFLRIDVTDPRTPVFAYRIAGEEKNTDKQTVIVELDKQDIINYLQEELKKIDKDLSINTENIEIWKNAYNFEILFNKNPIGWIASLTDKNNHDTWVYTKNAEEYMEVEGRTLEEKIKILLEKFKKTKKEDEETEEDSDEDDKLLDDVNHFKKGEPTKNYRFGKSTKNDSTWIMYKNDIPFGELTKEEKTYTIHFESGKTLLVRQ